MIASDNYDWDLLILSSEIIEDYIVNVGLIGNGFYVRVWDKENNFKGGSWARNIVNDTVEIIDNSLFKSKLKKILIKLEELRIFI